MAHPEAIHIPHTEPSQRLDEVPRGKPVYTYCRLGFRSHFAYCVLKQHGWGVAFLSGGMMTHPSRRPQDAAVAWQSRPARGDEPYRGILVQHSMPGQRPSELRPV